ncbi:betaine/proline/choline family ABC transporter ATP-binding protein [Chloroflexota bacterium]
MIRIERVTKRYGDTVAVNDLSLEINNGEVCVLIGPSGCGKTTTLRMINRLIEPSSGRIFIDGQDTSNIKAEQLRLSIGYAIQSVGLFPHMTVAENIDVVPSLLHWEKQRRDKRIKEMLNLVGLKPSEYSGKYPQHLSGGEAQRIGVARALAADPAILLMDEPFGAVDPLTRERLQDQFVRIQREIKKTIILVTHDLDEAVRLADRIAIMAQGTIVQYDTPETLLSEPASKFVRDFVGTDRALKRLSRLSVRDYMKAAPEIKIDSTGLDVASAMEGERWLWVVNDKRHVVGWVDRENLVRGNTVKEAMVKGDSGEFAVTDEATVREALSRMLGQGLKYIPVVNDQKQLIGELSLRDIESATAEIKG